MKHNRLVALSIMISSLALAGCALLEEEEQAARGRLGALESPEGLAIAVGWIATGIEVAGIAIITIGLAAASISMVQELVKGASLSQLYQDYRRHIGRVILLGLEFLVAADIVATVTVSISFRNLFLLGLIVLIRTFLSFAIEIEINERWPWQSARSREASQG